jgi:CRP-like cAMP-binding protein
LHYVLSGDVDILKGGKKRRVTANIFIGELAFLRKRPATATVTVSGDAHYITWRHADLLPLLRRDTDLSNGLQALLSRDMAEKMARS